jgi:ribonucleotide monophosphatase NagD (HAD superfamily)
MCRQLDMTSEEGGNLTDVFTIGDNPKSDIEGTNNLKSVNKVNWTSILMETGVWKQGGLTGFRSGSRQMSRTLLMES